MSGVGLTEAERELWRAAGRATRLPHTADCAAGSADLCDCSTRARLAAVVDLLARARAEGAREALEAAAREFAYTGPRMSDTGRQAVRLWLLDRAASAADLADQGEEGQL